MNYPDGKKNTAFWGYVNGTNQNTMLDEVINKRAINNRSFTTSGTTTFNGGGVMTLSTALSSNIYVNDKIKISGTTSNDGYYKILNISVNRLVITIGIATISETIATPINIYTQTYIKWSDYGIDKIAIFNTICDFAELKVKNGENTDFINTFELFCFNEPTRKLKNIISINKNFNQKSGHVVKKSSSPGSFGSWGPGATPLIFQEPSTNAFGGCFSHEFSICHPLVLLFIF